MTKEAPVIQDELPPCPFCASDDAEMRPMVCRDKGRWVVLCLACSASGPYRECAQRAIDAWSARALATHSAPESGALEGVLAAWEALPGGRHYAPKTIDAWLNEHMAPAIIRARHRIASLPTPAHDEAMVGRVARAICFRDGTELCQCKSANDCKLVQHSIFHEYATAALAASGLDEAIEALEPFAKQRFTGSIWEDGADDDVVLVDGDKNECTVGDFRRARLALANLRGKPE